MLTVLALLLLERKIVLVSARASLPNEIASLLLSLTFPFEWQCCCMPRLPAPLLGLIDCPQPYVVGLVVMMPPAAAHEDVSADGAGDATEKDPWRAAGISAERHSGHNRHGTSASTGGVDLTGEMAMGGAR